MNRRALIATLTAVMLILTFSFALGSSVSGPVANGSRTGAATASVYTGSVTIYPNGTVSAPGVFSKSGDTYTLLQNVSGSITDLRNNSAINGNGFTVSNPSGVAIYFQYVSNVSVSNVHVTGSNYGIYFYYAVNGSATTVDTQSTIYGFYSEYSSGISLTASRFNASDYSVYLYYTNSVYISDVIASNQSYDAIYCDYGSGLSIQNTTASSTGGYSEGIYVEYGNNAVIRNNIVNHAYYGLDLEYLSNVQTSGNKVTNSTDGMYLYSVDGFSSSHDSAAGSTQEIYIDIVTNAIWQFDNFSQTADGVSVYYGTNLTFTHSNFSNVTIAGEYGLYVDYGTGVSITYDNFNESASNVYGIYLDYVTGATSLYHDSIYAPSSYGVYLDGSNSLNMNFSNDNAEYPVYVSTTTTETIFNSDVFVVQSSGVGLYFDGSINSNIIVSNSSFYVTSTSSSAYGIEIYSTMSNYVEIANNYFDYVYEPVSVDPIQGSYYTIVNNTMASPYDGVFVYDIYYINVSYNHISNVIGTGNAIWLEDTYSNTVTWNTITLNSSSDVYAIYGSYSYGGLNIYYHNLIKGNASQASTSSEGIYLYENYVGQNVVMDNTVISLYYSIDVEDNVNVTVSGNSVNLGGYGIYSYYNVNYQYFGNTVTNESYTTFYSGYDVFGSVYANTFENATSYTLYIYDSSSATYYHNNFLNGSSVNTYFSGNALLSWNLSVPVGGNYWSNYTGTGSNGFGTTPYTVNGTNIDYLPLTSMWSSPTLTFVETGLPAGMSWSATLGSSTLSSTSAAIVFQPSNVLSVNRSYSIGTVSGYVANVTGGTLLLTGSSQVVMVAFTPYTYAVTFTETGLQSGTSWSVTLNGTTRSSTSTTITFDMPNGSYSYTINTVTNYNGGGTSGTAAVSSAGTSISATYTQIMYTLTVVEAGLPSGSSWSVAVNGATHTSTTPTISVQLPAGTYNVTVTGPSGYKVTLQTSTVTVSSTTSALSAQFSKTASATSSSTLGEGIGVGVVVGIIVGVIAGIVVAPRIRKGKQQ